MAAARFPIVLWAASLLSGVAAAQSSAPATPVGPIDRDLLDPAELFARACATCHGLDGSGTGPTVLDRPARNFKEGGFSIGNTPEALFRTITHGIPGSPLPTGEQALSAEQRRVLAEHVLSLGPPQRQVSEEETRLVVGDRPLVVRGILPPLEGGTDAVPRGLLVGTPDGLTFQYDLDGVRLLAVRAGEFVRRTDWGGRGGTPLEPLGQVVWQAGPEAPRPAWTARYIAGKAPDRSLRLQLLSTDVLGDSASLTGALVDADDEGRPLRLDATLRESLGAAAAHGLSGFRRTLAVMPERPVPADVLRVRIADEDPLAPWRLLLDGADPTRRLDTRPSWWMRQPAPDRVEILGARLRSALPHGGRRIPLAGVGPDGLTITFDVHGASEVEVSLFLAAQLPPGTERLLREETAR
jgi:mono/diheme cytochrome c family protein